jgi:RimJ/RimL family protein N-acetyltransferase
MPYDIILPMRVSLLRSGDETPLEAFLAVPGRAETSMFLRSNSRAGGLVDRGKRYQATYAAIWEDDAIVAVAAHCWNGMLLVQSPALGHVGVVAHAAVEQSGREVTGLSGPWPQVVAARAALDLAARPASMDSREDLFSLELGDLVVPSALTDRACLCRRLEPKDVEQCVAWRIAFRIEALGEAPGEKLETTSRETILGWPSQWVLTVDDALVAYSAFNASLPDMVQIGGVYTPPALRGRGYAQAVVAGSLLTARAEGVGRAILFTQASNAAARTAYQKLGFQIIGDYGLVLF